MDVRLNSSTGEPVAPLPSILARLHQTLQQQQHLWQQRLHDDPGQFADVALAVHHTFQQLADQVVAGLLAELGQSDALETPCKKSR